MNRTLTTKGLHFISQSWFSVVIIAAEATH